MDWRWRESRLGGMHLIAVSMVICFSHKWQPHKCRQGELGSDPFISGPSDPINTFPDIRCLAAVSCCLNGCFLHWVRTHARSGLQRLIIFWGPCVEQNRKCQVTRLTAPRGTVLDGCYKNAASSATAPEARMT